MASADPRAPPVNEEIRLPPPYYRGLYCPGCEQFYAPAELDWGVCAGHRVAPEPVTEQNWFFRLSRYTGDLLDVLQSGRVRVEPATRRNEVLAFVRAGLADFSVSRPATRAGGWGIPVPGDPGQIIYVWWDALANYIAALGYGGDEPPYRDWWVSSGERVHVIGKGVTVSTPSTGSRSCCPRGSPCPARSGCTST
jgi:methionyl-tRNA synthetase